MLNNVILLAWEEISFSIIGNDAPFYQRRDSILNGRFNPTSCTKGTSLSLMLMDIIEDLEDTTLRPEVEKNSLNGIQNAISI